MSVAPAGKSADQIIRDSMGEVPIPAFDTPAFTIPPALPKARVAIVTTGGLMRPGEDAWTHDDASFRVFERSERDFLFGHVSMNFDRSGLSADINVAYPIDRLEEMAAEGVIGSVAPRHISFMGALRGDNLMSSLILDFGPAAAKILVDDGVDVAVLTPLCPGCPRTLVVLAHVLEAQGLSTIVLASNLRLTQRGQAPRALYCDFPIGRPLGRPGEPVFQRRVLDAAFALLNAEHGPVLEVFPESIVDEADSALACSLPPRFDPSVPAEIDEAKGLRHAWERARAENGRSQLGRILSVDQIGEGIAGFIRVRDGESWASVFASEDAMMRTGMDIRIYYEEAAQGLSGHVPAARSAEAWFYQKTNVGALLKAVVLQLRKTGAEAELDFMALYYLVPLSQFPDGKNVAPWANHSGKIES